MIGPKTPPCAHCEGPTSGHAQEEIGHPYGPTYFEPTRTMMSAGWLCCECWENAVETEREYERLGINEREEANR
jgi:hypothetical protein